MREDEVTEDDFIIGVIWNDLSEGPEPEIPDVLVE